MTGGRVDFKGALVCVDPRTGTQSFLSPEYPFRGAMSIAVRPEGSIYAPQQNPPGGVYRLDLRTGAKTLVASGGFLVRPTGLAMDHQGMLIVADTGAGPRTGAVIRIDPASGDQAVIATGGGLVQPTDVGIAPNGDIFVADFGDHPRTAGVFKIDHVTGALTRHTAEGRSFRGIAIDRDGNIYGTECCSQVLRVDATTGAVTTVSEGEQFRDLYGIAVEADGQILVADLLTGKVLRVDPESGTQTVVSTGGYLWQSLGIGVWPESPVPTAPTTWGRLTRRSGRPIRSGSPSSASA